jgi:hypothetical protein
MYVGGRAEGETVNGRERFEAIWVPRVGEEAAAVVRRTLRVEACVRGGAWLPAVGAGLAFGNGVAGDVFGSVLVLLIVAAFAWWMQARKQMADALSRVFGTKISTARAFTGPSLLRRGSFERWRKHLGLPEYDSKSPAASSRSWTSSQGAR